MAFAGSKVNAKEALVALCSAATTEDAVMTITYRHQEFPAVPSSIVPSPSRPTQLHLQATTDNHATPRTPYQFISASGTLKSGGNAKPCREVA